MASPKTPVRDEYPSASITFFTFGPLLFRLEDLDELDHQPFIAPEDLARLKHIQRYSLVLPTRNISRDGKSLQLSVRETLHEFFEARPHDDPPLIEALRWILFRGWIAGGEKRGRSRVARTPAARARTSMLTPNVSEPRHLPDCGGPIYLIDALRLHERIDEEQARAASSRYVMTTLEQIVLVHLVKTLWELKPQVLSEVLFIKDGPLAFFGQTAPLSQPMRELAAFSARSPTAGRTRRDAVRSSTWSGLEKSGAFVEHAHAD